MDLVTTVVCLVVKVHFATREDLRKKWLNVLKHVHRKGGTGSFDVKNPNKRICVCEFRFKDEDLTTILGRRKNKVRLGEFLQYSESNK